MNPALTHIQETLLSIQTGAKKEIIGQDALLEKLIITIFAGGHALLEWVPGLGKTKTIRTISDILGLDTKRISFTPDLIPSDLTGNEIYRPQKGDFHIRKGPIFTNILLADEINRTPPKVQSALLEAMEEKRVTISETTFTLSKPFIVFATQNPLEHEGTYPLPEAQLDRFLMRIHIDYPLKEDEKQIFIQETSHTIPSSDAKNTIGENIEETDSSSHQNDTKNEVLTITGNDIIEMTEYISDHTHVDDNIYDYISDILHETRRLTHDSTNALSRAPLAYGASTRAGLSLIRASKVRAVMQGRDYVMPEDIKWLAHDIIDHRIGLSYEAISEWITQFTIVSKILETVKIP